MNCIEAVVEPQRKRAAHASRLARGAFSGILGIAFVACAAATVWSCRSMSAMGEIPMPGGWSMSTIWLPACGQTWLGAAVAFVRMWTLMMAAMMLPSSTPELYQGYQRCQWSRCGQAMQPSRWIPAARASTAAWSTLLMAICYVLSWAVAGAIVFAVGNSLAANFPRAVAFARLVPLGSGMLVVAAGAVQFTSWKARRIACCEALSVGTMHAVHPLAACKLGFKLALEGGCCCANLMAALLVVGMTDPRAMAAATAAMTLERVAPAGGRTARGIGIAVVAVGLYIVVQAVGTGAPAIR